MDIILIILLILLVVAGLVIYVSNAKKGQKKINGTTQVESKKMYIVSEKPKFERLILGDGKQVWGELYPYDNTISNKELQNFEVSNEVKLNLNNLIHHAPSLVTNLTNSTSNLYTLSVSPELQKGLVTGSLSWMKGLGSDGGIRGVVVDKTTGLIQGHGILLQAGALQSLNVATAIWQVMAIITAQKFLADINQQLGQINSQIQKLRGYLEQKDQAELLGSLKYLTQIRDLITGQKLDRDELGIYLHQIENIELKTLQQTYFYSSQMVELNNEFKNEPLNKGFLAFGDSGKLDKLKKMLADYEQISELYLVTIALRTLAAQVRGCLPFSQALTLARFQDSRIELDKWLSQKGEFYQLIESRIQEKDSWLNDEKPQLEFQQFVENNKLKTKKIQAEVAVMLDEAEKKVKVQIEDLGKPLALLIELDKQNQVTQVFKVGPEKVAK